jgi:hypothetical protein
MKQIVLPLSFVFMLSFVLAVKPPFDQCIRVQNYPENLTCLMDDGLFIQNMTEGNDGLFCVEVNSSYNEGVYYYSVNCTDGSTSKFLYDFFEVDEVLQGGNDVYMPLQFNEDSGDFDLIDWVKGLSFVEIVLFFVVFTLLVYVAMEILNKVVVNHG